MYFIACPPLGRGTMNAKSRNTTIKLVLGLGKRPARDRLQLLLYRHHPIKATMSERMEE
jgi:hypothetical protein